jgi:hypothetical protein
VLNANSVVVKSLLRAPQQAMVLFWLNRCADNCLRKGAGAGANPNFPLVAECAGVLNPLCFSASHMSFAADSTNCHRIEKPFAFSPSVALFLTFSLSYLPYEYFKKC